MKIKQLILLHKVNIRILLYNLDNSCFLYLNNFFQLCKIGHNIIIIIFDLNAMKDLEMYIFISSARSNRMCRSYFYSSQAGGWTCDHLNMMMKF